MSAPELVVLLDEAGHATGTAPKAEVHHRETPLHLAFSCYVVDAAGRLLLTQRAHGKPTWPGWWTNTVCGHPGPGEALEDAVRRRADRELGLKLDDVALVLPAFRYRAQMPDGVVENELCPVFTATTRSVVVPAADEVAGTAWVPWQTFRTDVLEGRREVTPWCRSQVEALPGDLLAARPAADRSLLPPAAHT